MKWVLHVLSSFFNLPNFYDFRKSPKENTKEGKKPRKWDLGGGSSDVKFLDYTKDSPSENGTNFTSNTEVSQINFTVPFNFQVQINE